jgi:phasin family protein
MDQLFAIQQELLQKCAESQENFEKHARAFIDLQSHALKNQLSNFFQTSKQILSSKTPQEHTNASTQFLAPLHQQVSDYHRQLADLMTRAGQDLQNSMESLQKDYQKHTSEVVDAISKNSPLGTEQFSSYIKSAIATTSKIVESASKAAQQVVSANCNNMKSQADATNHAYAEAMDKNATNAGASNSNNSNNNIKK